MASTVLLAALSARYVRPGAKALVGWLFVALVAPTTLLSAEKAVLQGYELVPDAQGWQLHLSFDKAPTQVRIGKATADAVRLELAGCRAAAEVSGQGYESGPLSAVKLEHRKRGLALELKTRQAMEYTVSASVNKVTVGLRRSVPPEQRRELGRNSALTERDQLASRPSADRGTVSVDPPAARVEVSEPLANVATSAYSIEKVTVTAPLARRLPEDPVAQLEDQLQGWAAAWREQDVERYLTYYSMAFEPADGGDRETWAAVRRQRLGRPLFIDVQLEEIETRLLEDDRGLASFWQVYRSDAFSDRVRKTMTWVEENGTWKIVGEQADS